MVLKPEHLVELSQSTTGSFDVQSQVGPANLACVGHGPVQEPKRNLSSGIAPSHGEPVDVGSLAWQNIGPELRIVQLKPDHAANRPIILGKIEEAGGDFCTDAFRRQLIVEPERHSASFQPMCGFLKHARHAFEIPEIGLSNVPAHRA